MLVLGRLGHAGPWGSLYACERVCGRVHGVCDLVVPKLGATVVRHRLQRIARRCFGLMAQLLVPPVSCLRACEPLRACARACGQTWSTLPWLLFLSPAPACVCMRLCARVRTREHLLQLVYL